MATIQELPPSLAAESRAAADLDVLDLALPLVRHKYVISLATAFGLLMAMAVALLTRNVYTATAVIMPPQQSQSSAGLLSQLGGSLSGLGGAVGLKDPNDLYIDLLQSETVQFGVIRQLDLQKEYRTPTPAYARLVLGGNSKFVSMRGGLLNISVKDLDPRQAAKIANAYVDQLHQMNDNLAITEASRRAAFFGNELSLQKARLADAEEAFQQTQQKTGAIAPGNQTSLVIQQIAELQAQIHSREVQLQSLRLSSTEQNPDVILLNSEMAVLRSQLRALEGGATEHQPGDVQLTSQSVPGAQLNYSRKLREVSYETYLVDLIARQYEAAKLDEAKAAPIIQLVDPAHVPEWKTSPSRTLWTVVGGCLGFFVSCLVIVGHHLYYCILEDEQLSRRLDPFRRAWRSGL
jgi:tyrosine-protein kinase Etk/Wzc